VPVYEYRCANGHYYDKTEGFDAPRQQACSVCGSTATRQISLPAVIFKGPGFYSTDNRGSSRGGNGKGGESDSSTTSSDEHGHSHGDGGQSHGSDSGSKAEAAASD
jgi:putative FmdB family regulatory protein